MNKFLNRMLIVLALAALVLAKETPKNQPLSNLDNVLKQANGVQVDAIMDGKLASNVSNALNDMASNLRKLFVENRRLSMQVQDVLQRVQNATGVNATNAMGNLQQQSTNVTSLSNLSLGNVLNRMQNP